MHRMGVFECLNGSINALNKYVLLRFGVLLKCPSWSTFTSPALKSDGSSQYN